MNKKQYKELSTSEKSIKYYTRQVMKGRIECIKPLTALLRLQLLKSRVSYSMPFKSSQNRPTGGITSD